MGILDPEVKLAEPIEKQQLFKNICRVGQLLIT
jgi:hypothetical protein